MTPAHDHRFEPSLGVRRRLTAIANADGRFTMLAIDHRQNLKRALGEGVSDKDLTDFKLEVIGALGPAASSVLVDPEYGAAQAIATGALAGTGGMVVAVEATGYVADPAGRISQILEGWSIEQAVALGADGVKLLVYYHPDAPNAPDQEQLVADVAYQCRVLHIPLFLEPLSYSLDDAPLTGAAFTRVVTETARRLTAIGGDVLKAEFPAKGTDHDAWAAVLEELDAATRIPWVILSAGVAFSTFHAQAVAAAAAGACGVMVGRAVWNEAVGFTKDERRAFLEGTATDRLHQLEAIEGPGWQDRAPALPLPGPRWFTER